MTVHWTIYIMEQIIYGGAWFGKKVRVWWWGRIYELILPDHRVRPDKTSAVPKLLDGKHKGSLIPVNVKPVISMIKGGQGTIYFVRPEALPNDPSKERIRL